MLTVICNLLLVIIEKTNYFKGFFSALQNGGLFFRTPAGVRTLDTLIKSQVLYQLSYKRIIYHTSPLAFLICVCKGNFYFSTDQIFCYFFANVRVN